MPGMIVFHTSGTTVRHNITKVPELEELQALVGGSIEIVPLWDEFAGEEALAICNEEGKIKNLPVNHAATTLWYSHLGKRVQGRGHDDVLVGDVVVIYGAKLVEDF
jgi:hypothetical protein